MSTWMWRSAASHMVRHHHKRRSGQTEQANNPLMACRSVYLQSCEFISSQLVTQLGANDLTRHLSSSEEFGEERECEEENVGDTCLTDRRAFAATTKMFNFDT